MLNIPYTQPRLIQVRGPFKGIYRGYIGPLKGYMGPGGDGGGGWWWVFGVWRRFFHVFVIFWSRVRVTKTKKYASYSLAETDRSAHRGSPVRFFVRRKSIFWETDPVF